MARTEIVQLTDDLDPKLEATTTVAFSYRGTDYEIDLADKNAEKFDKAMAPWLGAARKVKKQVKVSGRKYIHPAGRSTADRDLNKEIRSWAVSKGLEVAPRGRLKQEVVDAYYAEN